MRVLVTGSSGRIGSRFVAGCEDGTLDVVRADLSDAGGSRFPFVRLDVTDERRCREACEGVDAVLHLAADPDPGADFPTSVLPLNMIGTYHMANAAAAAGVVRFVFASSIQAVEGYPADRQIRESDPPRPPNDYGVGKAFGEALCASLAFRSTTAFVSVRIGNYAEHRPGEGATLRDRSAWLSPRDADQLLTLALTRDAGRHLVAHGVSNNAVKRLSIEATRSSLGYDPVDDAFTR